MPGPTIDVAFVKQYEREVHEAYQRQGSMLRGTVRTKTVNANDTTFQKMGTGVAVTKARHSEIPPMNVEHTTVNCALQDYYAREMIDKLDELKINHDERAVVTRAGAWALGRKTDELIIDAANTSTTTEGGANALIAMRRILVALEQLQSNDVPMTDGMLYGFLTPRQHAELLNSEDEYKSKDYIDASVINQPYRPIEWLGVKWMVHTGLPGVGTTTSTCMIWHHDALGHAIGAEITSDIQWINPSYSHSVVNAMSQGACLIDERACVLIPTNDEAALS